MARTKKILFSEFKLTEEKRVISDINLLFEKKGIIPYLIAHPGIGKTSILSRINSNYLIYNVSSFNEMDLIGTEKKEPIWYKELLKLSENSDRCLLIFDDFDRISARLQKYFLDLTEKRKRINNLNIPSNADVLLCGVSEEYSDYLLDFKLNSKLKRVELKTNIDEWMHWANNNGVNNVVKSYLNENPMDLLKDIKNKNGKYNYELSLTPRSWVNRISNELNISEYLGIEVNLDSCMDNKTKEKFLEYKKRFDELNVNDIIMGKTKNIDRFTYVSTDISFITNALIVSVYKIEELENAIYFLNKVGYSEYKDLFLSLWSNINDNNNDLARMRDAIINVLKKGEKNDK